ncbi:4-demethylwyosine synthase TYW1 [Candidatus Woesearchaeota archaeon]|jgi:tRNA wybutosine-synthesizing protein 1|nr:4-demethylwyosine synthase TYW1 [Candidatus Woesearchaeota archaeon]MBT5397524.1 4-demethylwyosine synthase TYW1 [Candidatus Woesearchaeota archaeon]MBT6367903.1 4-demethylwyosine synthase TYW1 [Candidatus Woesearchaeota archaeon]MBT7763127.1 4-demethylwyosine synthase TYW1 [Candidatus Woesearchaeota archaeon]
MVSKDIIEEMEKQQYRFVGSHSAVKVCGWTRNMINDKGSCYKHKFYGIQSNKCMQMTTCLSCANRCLFCWRGHKEPVSKEWNGTIDNPEFILTKSLEAHHKLLVGFKGSDKAVKYNESTEVKHVALSLTGEPIIYPKINEFIDLCSQKGISTFLVTNAQYPEHIKSLNRVTQLYLSVDAPTKELLQKIDVPLFADYWKRLLLSLQYLSQKEERTCIRLTVIKNINDTNHKEYANLITQGNPDFIEVKAYMHVGSSRDYLERENMPLHENVVTFSRELAKHLPDYELMSEHIPSRVVLFAKKKFLKDDGWHTWIDFTNPKNLVKTPVTGISGKGTLD